MSSPFTRGVRRSRRNRRATTHRGGWIAAAVVTGIVLCWLVASSITSNLLWFSSLHFQRVYLTRLLTGTGLFLAVGTLVWATTAGNMVLAAALAFFLFVAGVSIAWSDGGARLLLGALGLFLAVRGAVFHALTRRGLHPGLGFHGLGAQAHAAEAANCRALNGWAKRRSLRDPVMGEKDEKGRCVSLCVYVRLCALGPVACGGGLRSI